MALDKLTQITTSGINSTTPLSGINVTGIITASSLSVSGITTGAAATFDSVDVLGVLTYDDVTNVDALGIVTARTGVHVTSGSVGIGTDNPTEKLDVRGHLKIDNGPVLENHGTGDALRVTTPSGYCSIGANNTSYAHFYTDRDKFFFNKKLIVDQGIFAAYNEDLHLATNSSGTDIKLTILNSNGNIGIGTDNPSDLLNVYSTGQTRVRIEGDGSATTSASLILQDNDAGANFRGHGVFYYDSISDIEWFSGRPYSGSDAFSIHRQTSVTTPGDTTANKSNLLFIIDSAGNAGIGTDSPTYALDIQDSGAEAVLSLNRTDAATAGVLLVGSGNNANFITGGGNKDLFFATDNTERMRLDASGNFGIGTINPQQKLHLKGTIQLDGTVNAINDNYSRVYQNSSGSVDYGLQLKHYQGDTDDADAAILIGGDTSSREGNIVFYRDVSGTNTETARFDSAGNVGIGTDDPQAKLEIFGGITKTGGGEEVLRVESSDAANIPACITQGQSDSTLSILSGGLSSGSRRGGQIDFIGGTASSDAGTIIFRSGAGGGGTPQPERMRLAASGNFGIGALNPNFALDVVGEVRASTGILFGTDTAAANTLDDYEEGTWTPVYAGNTTAGSYTYGNRTGKYTLIGNKVTVWCAFTDITTSSAGSGAAKVTGLPFANGGAFITIGTLLLDKFNMTSTSIRGIHSRIGTSATEVILRVTRDGLTDTNIAVTDKVNNGSDVEFCITYLVS